jgi:DNA-binding transcriptional LysR family regulator
MEFRQLQYFISIAEYLNFRRAAEHHYVAQPALSRSIANLEIELGVKLFERNQHMVKLTKPGELFLKEAKRIIDISNDAILKARQLNTDYLGNLNIGFVPTTFYKYFLPKWISDFRAAHQDIKFSITQYNSAMLHEALEHDDIDMGFTLSSDIKETPVITSKLLYQDHVSLIMRADNPFAETNIDFPKLTLESFIMLSDRESFGFFNMAIQICRNRGLNPNIISMPTLQETVLVLTDAGIGMTLLPSTSKNSNWPNLKTIQIPGNDTAINMIAAWKRGNNNPILPILLDFLTLKTNMELDMNTAPCENCESCPTLRQQ